MNDSDHGLNLEFNLPVDSIVSSPHVDEDQLNGAIRTILHGADLEQLSRRMIRKQLEAQFAMDLSTYKDKINECILRVIEEQQQAEDEDEPEPSDADGEEEEEEEEEEAYRAPSKAKPKAKPTAAKKKATATAKRKRDADGTTRNGGSSAFNMKLSLSPELAGVVGAETMARPQIVKALWEYIREHDLQDPNNKRTILLDERLRNVFQRDTVTMFSLNKYIKRHAMKPENVPPGGWSDVPRDGASSDEDEQSTKKRKKAKK